MITGYLTIAQLRRRCRVLASSGVTLDQLRRNMEANLKEWNEKGPRLGARYGARYDPNGPDSGEVR